MIKPLKMPNLGTTTDEIKILRWLKGEGDLIKRGDPVFEIETDKATMEVESYLSGYLKKIVIQEMSMAKAGDVVAYCGDEQDTLEKEPQPETPVAVVSPDADAPKPEIGGVRVSPMLKALAAREGVALFQIKGSGPNGLIMRRDIIDAKKAARIAVAPIAPMELANDAERVGEISEQPKESAVSNAALQTFNGVGKAIARTMAQSKGTIPHVYFSIDVDATAIKALHRNVGIGYNAMIVYAVAGLLEKYPYLACRYDVNGRLMPEAYPVGLAMAKEDDLYVPVIKNTTTMAAIGEQISVLKKAMNEGGLKLGDMTGAVFTVSNLGYYGLSSFIAVINPPEVAILAVAGMRDVLVPVEAGVKVKPMINMTLSVDHRVANGTYAAAFLKELKDKLERIG